MIPTISLSIIMIIITDINATFFRQKSLLGISSTP